MNVYRVYTGYSNSQVHCVVAEDMAAAETLYKEKYSGTIQEIELISEYVIIQELKE